MALLILTFGKPCVPSWVILIGISSFCVSLLQCYYRVHHLWSHSFVSTNAPISNCCSLSVDVGCMPVAGTGRVYRKTLPGLGVVAIKLIPRGARLRWFPWAKKQVIARLVSEHSGVASLCPLLDAGKCIIARLPHRQGTSLPHVAYSLQHSWKDRVTLGEAN